MLTCKKQAIVLLLTLLPQMKSRGDSCSLLLSFFGVPATGRKQIQIQESSQETRKITFYFRYIVEMIITITIHQRVHIWSYDSVFNRKREVNAEMNKVLALVLIGFAITYGTPAARVLNAGT